MSNAADGYLGDWITHRPNCGCIECQLDRSEQRVRALTKQLAATRSDAHLQRSHEALVDAARLVVALFTEPSPFYIKKLGGPITNGDQKKIDDVFIALDAALTEAAAQEPQKEQHHD